MLKSACERNMVISFLHHGPCAKMKEKFSGKPYKTGGNGLRENFGALSIQYRKLSHVFFKATKISWGSFKNVQ